MKGAIESLDIIKKQNIKTTNGVQLYIQTAQTEALLAIAEELKAIRELMTFTPPEEKVGYPPKDEFPDKE
jgi:hypothetical protein